MKNVHESCKRHTSIKIIDGDLFLIYKDNEQEIKRKLTKEEVSLVKDKLENKSDMTMSYRKVENETYR